ncbi:MAG: hypothetical protein ACI4HI_15070 [Lachnospiraceae bacterium]
MSKDFDKQFRESINALHFSVGKKEELRRKLAQQERRISKGEMSAMKKRTLGKAVAIAAVCLMTTGGTVFATSKIASYVSSSHAGYDYKTIGEMTEAQSDVQGTHKNAMLKFPKTFDAGFEFEGGNIIHTSGKDDAGHTVENWKELSADYVNSDGIDVTLTMSYQPMSEQDKTSTESRTIDGVTVYYNYDEYLFVPEDYVLDDETKNRAENDPHFFVSEGADAPETKFYHSAIFEKNGITYLFQTDDNVTADDLYQMAEDLMNI